MIGLIFFNFSGQGEVNGRDFFIFSLFPMCSHHVPKRFPRVAQYICNSTSDLSHVVCKPKVIYTKKKCLLLLNIIYGFFNVIFNLQPFFSLAKFRLKEKIKNSKIKNEVSF
jgi:hypothetical protein